MATNPQQASLKEHEAIHNPTTLFHGCDRKAAVAALNASVTTLLNQGFCEEGKNDQTYCQEDLEYSMSLITK